MVGNKVRLFYTLCLCLLPVTGEATDSEVLNPRVPPDQIEEARSWVNPFPSSKENVENGKALFHGKAFCMTCH